jgi:F-type H+-transporting ATPase subunit a
MTAEGNGHAAASGGGGTPTELPSFLDILGVDMHQELFGVSLHDWLPVIMSVLVGGVLVAVSLWGTRRMEKIPSGPQALLEIIIEWLDDFFSGIIGKASSTYLPFLGSLFLYIILMNLWGLIPMMHSPTSKLNTTLALAIVVFVTTHFEGIRVKGPWGYLKHFLEPYFLAPIMFPVHIVGELARPASLALRLFGNLTGEDVAIASLVFLTPFILGIIPIPIHLIMVVLALLFSTVQAIVFTLLSSIYIGQAVGALEAESHD